MQPNPAEQSYWRSKDENDYDRNDGRPGVVYILANDAFPHLLKIGQTTRTAAIRARELNDECGTESPGRFSVLHEIRTIDCGRAEKRVHKQLRARRFRKEYFEIDIPTALSAVQSACSFYNKKEDKRKKIDLESKSILIGEQIHSNDKWNSQESTKPKANADHDILADIWRKQGVDEGLLDETHAVNDDDNRRHAIAVMGWTKRGFKTKDGEVAVPETMIRNHGVENTVRLVKKASDLLVRQGELDPAEAKARLDEMVQKIEAVGKRWKADEEVVFSNLTPIAEQKINDALQGLKEKDKARERFKLVRHFASLLNKEISEEDIESLEDWFGTRKDHVLDHFGIIKSQINNPRPIKYPDSDYSLERSPAGHIYSNNLRISEPSRARAPWWTYTLALLTIGFGLFSFYTESTPTTPSVENPLQSEERHLLVEIQKYASSYRIPVPNSKEETRLLAVTRVGRTIQFTYETTPVGERELSKNFDWPYIKEGMRTIACSKPELQDLMTRGAAVQYQLQRQNGTVHTTNITCK